MEKIIKKAINSLSITPSDDKVVLPVENLISEFLNNLTTNDRYNNFDYKDYPLYELIRSHIISVFYNYLGKNNISLLKNDLMTILTKIDDLYRNTLYDDFIYDSETDYMKEQLIAYNDMHNILTNLVIKQKEVHAKLNI